MSKIQTAICWATALVLLTLGVRFGVVDRDAAATMFFVIPILAVLSLTGRGCRTRRSEA